MVLSKPFLPFRLLSSVLKSYRCAKRGGLFSSPRLLGTLVDNFFVGFCHYMSDSLGSLQLRAWDV